MDRAVLIKLFLEGMRYPPGKRRLWVTRCFEVTIKPDQLVEVDEYESTTLDTGIGPRRVVCCRPAAQHALRHMGRSLLNLATGRVEETPGTRQPPGP